MTMHKSKGLEAPVVFIAGGFTAMQGPSPAISLFHEGARRCAWIGPLKGSPVEQQVAAEADQEDQRLLYVALTRAKARLYLPCVHELAPNDLAAAARGLGAAPSTQFKTLRGSYARLNARLAAMRSAGALTAANGFVNTLVKVQRRWEEPRPEPVAAAWTPPAELLGELPPDPRPAELRATHGGFFVTSYSRMSAARAGESGEETNDRFKIDLDAGWLELPENHLPAGAATGVFIHEVLELLPLDVARAAPNFEKWAARPDVDAMVKRIARRHGVEPRRFAHAKRLAWNAVRTSLSLPDGASLEGIAFAERALREVEFLYPIPERGHPLLARGAATGEYSIVRGCVKGFIDLIVEHQGRAYFADWKSDLMPSYEPDAIGAHVADHYAIQEQLYSLALARMLGIRSEREFEARFGGSLYLFLRGMEPGRDAGVHVHRPRWAELVSWEQELLRDRDWGVGAA
jgi:exodeoxyribonuclease V beta subunit